MKGLIPSPTSGIKERLRKRFAMVDVPEWNTTKTCRLCDGITTETGIKIRIKKKENGKFIKKKKETRDLKKCQDCGCILNRDRNGAMNILKNWLHFEQHKVWNPKFLPNSN
jgi:transposase